MRPDIGVRKVSTMGNIRSKIDPMQEPLEIAELMAFTETVERRSLSAAAEALGVPRATIGRRLARLEARLGTRLIRRTTRSLVLTDSGEALLRHARIVLDAVETAEASVRRVDDVVRGDLRVSMPPMPQEPVAALVDGFLRRYPEVRLHVHVSTAHVDLRRDGIDVAIRAGTAIDPGLVARTLATTVLVGVATPRYLAEHGTPTRLDDLAEHRCLMGFRRGELAETHWPRVRGGAVHVGGAFSSNDLGLLHALASAGQGIALLPLFLVQDALASGALVPVLPRLLGASTRVAVVYAERELLPPQVRAFVDAVVAWAPGALPRSLPEASVKPTPRVPAAPRPTPRPRRRAQVARAKTQRA